MRRITLNEPIYEASAAARVVGIPLRRLLGWVARDVFRPTIAARGRGTRRRFTRGDLLQLSIIAELQALLGSHLRPGSIAAEVSEWIEGTGGWPTRRIGSEDPGVILFSMDEGKVSVQPMAASKVSHALRMTGTGIVVNYENHMRRIEDALGEED